MSYEITMNDATAVATVINHLGVGIPKYMVLRELTMNAIEACLRNDEEKSAHGVHVGKDHQFTNKISIINMGGDFLSEETFQNNLATLGKTGNINQNGEVVMDKNKGIGAKIVYLPKARHGLLYRSVESGSDTGIYAQMCQNESTGVYELPDFHCEYTGEMTAWPVCDKFSERLRKGASTITEVVAMGDHEGQDTYLDLDQACSLRKGAGDGGTGYGIFRFLTHRFWNEPAVPLRVDIHEKSTGKVMNTPRVKGLLDFMKNRGCKAYGTVPLQYEGIDVKAHWSIVKDAGDPGYSSNWSASGYTAVAWKGEVYSDFKQHPLSVKKDINDCGVIIKHNKVLIVFEISSDVELNTSAGRTELYKDDAKIDKSLLHDLFRSNFPQTLRDWQEENQIANKNSADLSKQIIDDLKDQGFGHTTGRKGVVTPGLKLAGKTKAPLIKKLMKAHDNPRSAMKINSTTNLRNCVPPKHALIDDESASLIEFHLREYKVVLNTASTTYKKRRQRILDLLDEPCLVISALEFQLNRMLITNAIYTIFESNQNYADMSLQDRKERWQPQNLESNWNISTEKAILKIIKKENSNMKKAA
tara:strand:+ start:153 stop:1910 length:1758 start_codon:yes stop_codon:yes gene_type:complete